MLLIAAPLATFLVASRSGLLSGAIAAVSLRLFEQTLSLLAKRRRLERLRDAAEEPIQAMFEQASLFGSAELCALAALPACGPRLRPVWQRALAEWLRGSASEEAFRTVGRSEGLPLLVQLGRALSLSRRSGTPLARHLAVLLEDAAEERRRRHEAGAQTFPFFAVTAGLAGVVLLGSVWVLAQGQGVGLTYWIAIAALLTSGSIPLATAQLLP
ncbi:MAG: hypothetical protein M0Z66_05640 [Thermaerobacter sp.]|nr:hypothetical protein [Thermaerobacter sp.]